MWHLRKTATEGFQRALFHENVEFGQYFSPFIIWRDTITAIKNYIKEKNQNKNKNYQYLLLILFSGIIKHIWFQPILKPYDDWFC